MGNRVMGMKMQKLRMQNRKLPRRLSINVKGPRPAMEVVRDYRQRAASLGVDEANEYWRGLHGNITNVPIPNTPPGKVDIRERKLDILTEFDDPLFYTWNEVPNVQRVRVFFNSSKTLWCIQWMRYSRNEYRISRLYRSQERLLEVFVKETILWKTIKPIVA